MRISRIRNPSSVFVPDPQVREYSIGLKKLKKRLMASLVKFP